MSTQFARVVECYGRRVIVSLADGQHHTAEVFGKRLRVVCGDEVELSQSSSSALQVVAAKPRTSHFTRTDSRGQPEVLAANITQLVVLMCEQPASDPYIVDRYLAGAELGNLKALVVATKQELGIGDKLQTYLHEYQQAGHSVHTVSALTGAGMSELHELLRQETSMLVGESGVGKSTLTNALLGNTHQATREISEATGEGRHTTVSTALFTLLGGGMLLDSPGVRDYAPAPVNDLQVAFGWRDFQRYAGQCKFNNCLHLREPGCAITQAVSNQEISMRRYESYKRLLNLMRHLLPSYERR